MRYHAFLQPLAVFVIALTFTLVGCSPAAREKRAVHHKQKQSSEQAYRITMRLGNAPGPFNSMVALAQYDVTETECLPPPHENNGHEWPVPSEDVPIELTRAPDNKYTGVVYIDRMLDEDYYGRGVCHWQLIQARVHLKATGNTRGETLFVPSIPAAKIVGEQEETTFFAKIAYPDMAEADLDEFVDIGVTDRAGIGAAVSDNDLFRVTLTSSKDAP
jgi:hypothetical protein